MMEMRAKKANATINQKKKEEKKSDNKLYKTVNIVNLSIQNKTKSG